MLVSKLPTQSLRHPTRGLRHPTRASGIYFPLASRWSCRFHVVCFLSPCELCASQHVSNSMTVETLTHKEQTIALYRVCGLGRHGRYSRKKICSAHGRSTPEVGSGFPIEAYGSRGVSRPSLVIGNSNQNISANTDLLSPKQNFYLLTVCRLDQYLLNGSENTVLHP